MVWLGMHPFLLPLLLSSVAWLLLLLTIFPKIAVFKRDSSWSRGSQLVLISHVLQCPLLCCVSKLGLVCQPLQNSLSTS